MPKVRKPMPSDFPLYAECEGNLRLRKRFKVGGVTVEIWRRQLGMCYVPPAPKHIPKPTIRRKVRRLMRLPDERIDDLDSFDSGACLASGSYGDW